MPVPEISSSGKIANTETVNENMFANYNRNAVPKEAMKEMPAETPQKILKQETTDVFRHTASAELPAKQAALPASNIPVSMRFILDYPFANNGNNTRLDLIDLTDKLAAFFGEKEKAVKDSLSDTFKKQIINPFDSMAKIDTTMEQGDHSREKSLKDRDEHSQNSEDDSLKRIAKGFYYKLLDIYQEILNFKKKIEKGIKRGKQLLKAFIIRHL